VYIKLLLSVQVEAQQIHRETRAVSAAYIASFLARGKFVQLPTLLQTLRRLLSWAVGYQRDVLKRLQGDKPALDMHRHGVYYAVVQGVLYVLCYKAKLLQLPEVATELSRLGEQLGELLSGELNPLKFVQEDVGLEFERLHICECTASILSANENLAIASYDSSGGENALDEFFPFDPILLKGAATFIDPIYQRWQPAPSSPAAKGQRHSNTASDSLVGSDATSESLARSMQAMSVTPGSTCALAHTPVEHELDAHTSRRLSEHSKLLQSQLSRPTYNF